MFVVYKSVTIVNILGIVYLVKPESANPKRSLQLSADSQEANIHLHTYIIYIYNIYIYTAVWKAVIQSIHHGDVPVPLTFRHGFCISQEWVTLKSIGFAANKGISRRPCDFDIFRLRLSEYYKVAEEQEDSQEALLALTKGQERVRRQCFLLQPTHSGKKLCETVDGSEMRRL